MTNDEPLTEDSGGEPDSFTFSASGNVNFQGDVALPFMREVTEALLEDQWEEEEDVPGQIPNAVMFFGVAEAIAVIIILKGPVIDWVASGALDSAWAKIKRGLRRSAARQGEVGGRPFKIKTVIRSTKTDVTSVVEIEVANEGDYDKVEALMEQAHRQTLDAIREKNIHDAVVESRVEDGEVHLAPELTQS
jgi:hypothetical protein